MDKCSWPWKKKGSEKTLICSDICESSTPLASMGSDGQLIPVLKSDHIRSSAPASPYCSDEQLRHLNERLLAADDLAKQHAAVAEEAVSGWEMAKAEYVSVKQQLDMVVEQKHAIEIRVFHLDGALKDCMQQVRQFKEDQEREIHNAVIKRCRDGEKMRVELEKQLADMDRRLKESENQRNVLYRTMQEQVEAVGDLGRMRTLVDTEIKKSQVQIQTLEKENTSLKYEITLLSKELDIRNQEREINNRSINMASRQQEEGTKRIANLEAECQKLRALVRKKLPGPAALLQMKLEAGVDAEKGNFDSKQRSPRMASHADYTMQAERYPLLDEDFPKSPSVRPGFYVAPSHGSISKGGHDGTLNVATPRNSGFTVGTEHVKKEESSQYNGVRSNKMLEKLNSTDNFLEIERLLSLPSEKEGMQPHPSSIAKQILAKDAELQVSNKLCADVSKKLVAAKEDQSNNVNSTKTPVFVSHRMKWRLDAVQGAEQEVISDIGSPVSLMSNSDGSDSLAAKGSSADDRLASSVRIALNDEFHKVRAEKEYLASCLRRELLKRANASGVEGVAERSNKEQEITDDAAEKLAEWQHTVSILGKQLRDMATARDASSSKASTLQNQGGAPKDEPCTYGNVVSYAASGPTDASSSQSNVPPEDTGSGLETHKLAKEMASSSHVDSDKQLVVYAPKPATKKKALHLFGGVDMFKSVNSERSASPQKNGSSYGRLFSRNKNPS